MSYNQYNLKPAFSCQNGDLSGGHLSCNHNFESHAQSQESTYISKQHRKIYSRNKFGTTVFWGRTHLCFLCILLSCTFLPTTHSTFHTIPNLEQHVMPSLLLLINVTDVCHTRLFIKKNVVTASCMFSSIRYIPCTFSTFPTF